MSMQDQMNIVNAAGFDADRMHPLEMFVFAGKIIQDRVLWRLRCERQRRNPAIPELPAFLPQESVVEALREMAPHERQLLRERVSGVVQLPQGGEPRASHRKQNREVQHEAD